LRGFARIGRCYYGVRMVGMKLTRSRE